MSQTQDLSDRIGERYLTPIRAQELLGISGRTLKKWESDGKITCIRTKGNHRRYFESEIKRIAGWSDTPRKRNICYCRVSTRSQKEDLERQVQYFRGEFPNHEIIRDYGSGLNFKRKGFNSILESALKGHISEVVVTHRDRFCRFGFELIEKVIQNQQGRIVVLNQTQTSPQEELVNDLISIITVFSSRLHGLRSHTFKKKIREKASKDAENQDFSHNSGEGEIELDIPTV